MQQRCRRPVGHVRIAIGGAGGDPLEERASPARRREPRRSAFPTCRGWRSRCRLRSPRGFESAPGRRSSQSGSHSSIVRLKEVCPARRL
jgi:hypothetical protein